MDDSASDNKPQRTTPTINDVARTAGVSIGTVSKALNGGGKLRESTRANVRRVAEELGFRPNDLAQSLLRGRTYTIGLLTTDTYGRFSLPILQGIESALGESRISVFLCSANDDPVRERQHIDALLAKKVDGMIVTSRRIDPRPPIDTGKTQIPVIYALAQVRDANALSLLPDDSQGVRLAILHMIALGRRRFAHITGPAYFQSVHERLQAMREVLHAHGLDLPDALVHGSAWNEAWGYEAMGRILERGDSIDALFCANDLLARGAIDRLREHGMRVPADVAVVGFDNWQIIAEGSRPPLTSVDMNLESVGHLAATKLLAAIDGTTEQGVLRLPCRLVVRQSCGATAINGI